MIMKIFEKGLIYMKILKKRGGGVVEKRGEEETKSMPHAPVYPLFCNKQISHTLSCKLILTGK
jgi:hypothetical protein